MNLCHFLHDTLVLETLLVSLSKSVVPMVVVCLEVPFWIS